MLFLDPCSLSSIPDTVLSLNGTRLRPVDTRDCGLVARCSLAARESVAEVVLIYIIAAMTIDLSDIL